MNPTPIHSDQRGTASIESVLVAPFWILVFVLVIDQAQGYVPAQSTVDETRAAAWYVVRKKPTASATELTWQAENLAPDNHEVEAKKQETTLNPADFLGTMAKLSLKAATDLDIPWPKVTVQTTSTWPSYIDSFPDKQAVIKTTVIPKRVEGPDSTPSLLGLLNPL